MTAHSVYENRSKYYFNVSATMRGGFMLAMLLGVAAFGGGLASDPTRAWGAYLFNLFFFFCLALGGIAFAGMQDVIGAHWGRPIKRLHEGFAAFLPWAGLFFGILFLAIVLNIAGAAHLYSWIADPESIQHLHGK